MKLKKQGLYLRYCKTMNKPYCFNHFLIKLRCVFLFNCFFYSGLSFSQQINFITLDVPPWATTAEGSKAVVGMFAEIIDEIQSRTGLSITMSVAPYARINRELKVGRQDCTILIKDDERSEMTTLGQVVFNHPMGVLPHKSTEVRSYEDMHGLTVSVLPILNMFDKFYQDSNIKKVSDVDYETGIRKVKHKRVDAIAGAIPTIQYLAKREGYTDLFNKPFLLDEVPVYLQCIKTTDDMYMSLMNKAIYSMKKDGTMKKIENKFVNL